MKDKKQLSLKVSLIISISLVHAILMGLFVYHGTRESKELIREEMKGSAKNLARIFSTTATNAILSRDLGSLHEYVDKAGREQPISYVIIQDRDGKVLASTRHIFDGDILTDDVSRRANSASDELLQEADKVIDVTAPIFIGTKKVGLTRVGISTEQMEQKIAAVRRNGISMTILAILTGSAVAVIIALKVTKGLAGLGRVAGEMSRGNLNERAQADSYRELNELAHAFNQMSDAIQTREEEIQQSYEELEYAHEELQTSNEELQSAHEELESSNEELLHANERVMESDRLKSEFLANMSHELRTPLNSIIAVSGILLARMDGDLTEEQEKQVKMVQRGGRNLLELINDILDLSKIESGKMEIFAEEFCINEVVDDLVAMMTPLADEKRLKLSFSKAQESLLVRSDRNKVKQVISNLLSNGVKFTPRDGAVSIDIKRSDGSLLLRVSDTGIGIAKDNLDSIFDEFRQVDGSCTREYGGTGLGLAISSRLIKLLGGEIWVESEIGKGSVFTISLPER